MTTRVFRLLLGALLLLALTPSAASADRTFSKRWGVNDTGDIAIAGNTLMSCPSHCAAENGVGSGAALNDNNYSMVRLDLDGDAATTLDSSSATVDIPAGATVLWAGLYWGADTSGGGDDTKKGQVKLKVPGGSYTTVTSEQTDAVGARFQGFKTVTQLVKDGGAGQYWVGDVQEGTGTDHYGGWSLVVIYHDDAAAPRNLTVFDGFITIATATPTATINVSGFTTSPTGQTKTTLGAISYEGDLGSTGDGMDLDGQPISDAVNAADNIFNSTVSIRGTRVSGGRSPDQSNQMGFDADQFNADGLLGNSVTSAALHLTTGGETYYPGALTFASELLAPKIRTTTVVHDLNGGAIEPGDELEYEVTGTNTGNDDADLVTLTDDVSAGYTYVPGSLQIVSGAGAGAQTDAAGDDRATWDPATHRITWQLGTGATPTTGGSVPAGGTFVTRYHVTVGAPADGSSAGANATTSYTGHGTGDTYTTTGTTTGSPTVTGPDLAIDVTRGGALVRGDDASYTIAVANNGSGATHGAVTVTDDLPAGLELDGVPSGSGWDCSATTGTHVSCTRSDALAPAGAWPPITVPVKVRTDAPGAIADSASVTGGGDGLHANDTDSDSTTATSQAGLTVALDSAADAVRPGATTTITATVSNAGPSDASAVQVTFAIPAGLQLVSASVGGVTCTGATCALGTIASGASKDAVLVVRADDGAGSTTQSVTATETSTTPDTTTGDDAASQPVDVYGPVDLQVTAGHGDAAPVAGTRATFTATVHNAGPAAATGVVVTVPVPAGLTGVVVAVGGDASACTVAGGVATCHIDRIADGAAATITVTGGVPADAGGKTYTLQATAAADQADTDTGDDSATDKATAVAVADLGVEAVAPAGTIAAGQDTTFSIDVHNAGPSDASDVVVTQTLPAGAVVVDLDPRCAQEAQVITCRLGTVANGASTPLVFNVHAEQAFDGSALGAGASVSAASADANAANDTLAPAVASRVADNRVPASCLSRRVFTIHLRLPHQSQLRDVKVTVDGKAVKVTHTGKRLTARIDLRGRYKTRRVLVRISATRKAGQKIVGPRAYKTCDLKLPTKKAPKV